MARERHYDITLHLDDVREMFNAPDVDPFSGKARYESGLETIVDELRPKALTKKTRTTIILPGNKVEPDLDRKIRAALADYCQYKIRQNKHELIALRWKGLKALQDGVIFLAICLLLSAVFENAEILPDFLRRFLSEGFLIAGWVSLWYPIEVLLYEWWPFSRENRIYENILHMDISVTTAE